MTSTWDIISSGLFLAIFLGAVYYAVRFTSLLSAQKTTTQSSLRSQGVEYDPSASRISIKTDRAAPSRDEYIASTQAAFERGAKTMKAHKDAFSFGRGKSEENVPTVGSASGVESPADKRGFRRTKKLA